MALQDPSRKMDKSDPNPANTVYLTDEPKVIEKKFKSATTDSGSEITYGDDKPGVSNLLEIYSAFSGKTIPEVEAHFAGKMYGHLKVELGQLVVEKLKPIQDRLDHLLKDKGELESIMKKNALKAKAHASRTLARVYERVGFLI